MIKEYLEELTAGQILLGVVGVVAVNAINLFMLWMLP